MKLDIESDVEVRFWDKDTKIIRERRRYCNALTSVGIINILNWLANKKSGGYFDAVGIGPTGAVVPENITNIGFGDPSATTNYISDSIVNENKAVTIVDGVGRLVIFRNIGPNEANDFTWNELLLLSADHTTIARIIDENPFPKTQAAGATVQWTITLKENKQ